MSSVTFNSNEIVYSFSAQTTPKKNTSTVGIAVAAFFLSIASFVCYAKLQKITLPTERIKDLTSGALISGITLFFVGMVTIIYMNRQNKDTEQNKDTHNVFARDLKRLMQPYEVFQGEGKFYLRQDEEVICLEKHPSEYGSIDDECKYGADLSNKELEGRFLKPRHL